MKFTLFLHCFGCSCFYWNLWREGEESSVFLFFFSLSSNDVSQQFFTLFSGLGYRFVYGSNWFFQVLDFQVQKLQILGQIRVGSFRWVSLLICKNQKVTNYLLCVSKKKNNYLLYLLSIVFDVGLDILNLNNQTMIWFRYFIFQLSKNN